MTDNDTREALECLQILAAQCGNDKIRRSNHAKILKWIMNASKELNIRCSTKGLGRVWKEVK